jgi:single-stranded-DNA-specific exonuclease
MPDPSSLTDMDRAAERIGEAVRSGEKITVFGDYDVDGATSSATMSRFLGAVGVNADIYIPDRIFEGYGPNVDALKEIRKGGTSLLITVDCGTASHAVFGEMVQSGLDIVVLDHHQTDDNLPPAHAIVNPNRQDDLSGLGHLAAVGVTFLTIVAVNRALRQSGWYSDARPEPDLMQWLDLVALGTVCDSVALTGLNRAFVARGLAVMDQEQNAGLRALRRAARASGEASTYHLGFLLGPRINAGGRIGRADLGACLLTTEEDFEAGETAATLDRLNGERQEIEQRTLEVALAEAERGLGKEADNSVVIISGDDWHPGVVGLVATRVKDRFHRPTIAIAFNADGTGTGSGRSISGVDLGKAVRAAVEEGILLKGGGHAMAAGLTVERARLGDLRTFLGEHMARDVAQSRATDSLAIDGALTASAATPALMGLLSRASPYGMGNPEPQFVLPAHKITYADIVGAGHVKVALQSADGKRLDAISFRSADTPLGKFLLSRPPGPVHVAGRLRLDRWQGRERVQLQITDAAIPK